MEFEWNFQFDCKFNFKVYPLVHRWNSIYLIGNIISGGGNVYLIEIHRALAKMLNLLEMD